MKILFLLPILLITNFIECRGPRRSRAIQQPAKKGQQSITQPPPKKYVTITPYQARLEGVECKLCAAAATQVLSSLDGVDDVQIALINEEAEYAEVAFLWHKPIDAFDLTAINKALDKEGFEMASITTQKSIVTEVKS